jgi:NADH:ubiquinone oxidoreductase subunit 2 (subunit N)
LIGAQFLFVYGLALAILVSVFGAIGYESTGPGLLQRDLSTKTFVLISLLSLGGSPPFIGFYAKMAILQLVIFRGQIVWVLALVVRSVFLLYVYMRIFYALLSRVLPNEQHYFISRTRKFSGAAALAGIVIIPWV